jgi:predicted nucleic acid-binding protein
VSEDARAVPTPWVLDISVLVEVARGDARTMTPVQELDARGRPLVIPALAVTGASLDIHSDEAAELLEGLERLKNAMTAALRDAGQAVRLAAVIARTGLDPWDAHVAAVADAAVCPILTLDAGRWREHAAGLDEPLHFIEIADPDEAPGGSGPGTLGARGDMRSRHLAAGLACLRSGSRRRHQPGASAQAAGRTVPGGGHTAPACPVLPLCAGYAVGQPGMSAGLRLESIAMAARQTAAVISGAGFAWRRGGAAGHGSAACLEAMVLDVGSGPGARGGAAPAAVPRLGVCGRLGCAGPAHTAGW